MARSTTKQPAKPKRGAKSQIIGDGVDYSRYSSHSQKDLSIEQQIAKNEELAREYGIRLVEHYCDRAVTGRTDKRKDFQRMMRDAAKGKFKYVIAWKSNRMGRNMLEALVNEAKLQELGVRVLYVEEDFDDTAAGRFAARSMMNVNQFYSENMAEDIKRGLEDNASKCKVNGALGLGFKKGEDGRYALDEPKAAIVREIFVRVASLEPFVDIINDLNARGIKTSTGKAWNRSSFHRMLANERYRGVYIWGDIAHRRRRAENCERRALLQSSGGGHYEKKSARPAPCQRGLLADGKALLWQVQGPDGWHIRDQQNRGVALLLHLPEPPYRKFVRQEKCAAR